MKHRKTIGLALSGGWLRGLAHIGVVKTLEKHKIPINYLTGTSIGAWIAAYYAIFGNVEKLEEDLTAKPLNNLPLLLDVSWTSGLLGGRKLMSYLEKKFQHHDFSNLRTPLKIVTTDLITGQPFVFMAGDVARAVRASLSVPLVFQPLLYKGKLLVDGALSNPVPVNLARGMGANIVVAVDLYHKNEFIARKFNMAKVVLRSSRIVIHNLAKVDVRDADIVIKPDASTFINDRGLLKYFTKEIGCELIKIGERATERVIPQIKKLLAD